MRVLSTGYAVGFNRRHRRSGYVFQNRFESLLVEDEPYLLELRRYIHLHPLRAGLVTTLPALDGFAWTGHAARVRAEQDTRLATRPPVSSPAEGTAVLLALVQRAATLCGITPAAITSASQRAPAVAGRTAVADVAVLHLGMSSNAVARFLGVSRQSVRRGRQRSAAVIAEFRRDPEARVGGMLRLPPGTNTSPR